MLPAADPETMRALELLGITYDGIMGTYFFKDSPEFYFDFKKHEFCLDNSIPENCFPVLGSDKFFGEELVTAFTAQIEQFLIKDISNRDKLQKMYNELKSVKSPYTGEKDTRIFELYKKKYMLVLTLMLEGYAKRFDIVEKSLVQTESLVHHIQNSGSILPDKNKNGAKMGLFAMIHESLNTLKHPLLIEHKHLYDAKSGWVQALRACVDASK